MRRAAKVDANQAEIVQALRQIGAVVQSLAAVGNGCPDLLVGYRNRLFLLELKDGSHVCGTLSRKTHQLVGINIGGQSRKEALIDTSRIAFLGRVIWASQ